MTHILFDVINFIVLVKKMCYIIYGDYMNDIKHVGIIVDGNGRWATKRNLKRSAGHKEGAKTIKKIIKHIFNKNVECLSLYIFSTENFKRSDDEVNYLMKLFIEYFKKEFNDFNKHNIKIVFSGRKDNLSNDIIEAINNTEEKTKHNTKRTLNFCLNYGSHYEIVDACNNIIKEGIEEVDIDLFEKYLYQSLPNIDLLIRTGGEVRLSNFMLWQLSYAELFFTNTLFPDLTTDEVDNILENYKNRDRRYGAIDYEKIKKGD